MAERLRFTGENPPPRLWDRFPNWEYAFDEENLPGQDETTIRPASNQQTIDESVTFTAGDAVSAAGTRVSALISVDCCEADWIYVYPKPEQDKCWVLRFDVSSAGWVAMNDDWFVAGEGILTVPVDDSTIFPLLIRSRLPLQKLGKPIEIEVNRPSQHGGVD